MRCPNKEAKSVPKRAAKVDTEKMYSIEVRKLHLD